MDVTYPIVIYSVILINIILNNFFCPLSLCNIINQYLNDKFTRKIEYIINLLKKI